MGIATIEREQVIAMAYQRNAPSLQSEGQATTDANLCPMMVIIVSLSNDGDSCFYMQNDDHNCVC